MKSQRAIFIPRRSSVGVLWKYSTGLLKLYSALGRISSLCVIVELFIWLSEFTRLRFQLYTRFYLKMLYSPRQIGNMGKYTIFMSILGGLILGKALWENAWGKMRDKSQLGKLRYGEFA